MLKWTFYGTKVDINKWCMPFGISYRECYEYLYTNIEEVTISILCFHLILRRGNEL